MDWITKLGKEEQAEQQRQSQAQVAKRKRETEVRERFQIIRDNLCPVIETTISELKKRRGFELQMNVGDTSLVVRAPHPRPQRYKRDGAWYESFGRISDHRFEISSISDDGKTVHILATRAGETNRNPDGWEESGMSHADYFGSDKTVIDTQNEISKLVSEDIHLLLEWVVRQELEDKDIPPPELSGVQQRKKKKKSAFLEAYGGLAVGIVAFFLMLSHSIFALLGPLSIYLGLHARRELSSLGITYEGHGVAKWAIGLGIFESVMFLLAMLLPHGAFR